MTGLVVFAVIVLVATAVALWLVSLAFRPEETDGEMTFAVADTAVFAVGMPIQIDGEQMVVTAILGQYHLRVRR